MISLIWIDVGIIAIMAPILAVPWILGNRKGLWHWMDLPFNAVSVLSWLIARIWLLSKSTVVGICDISPEGWQGIFFFVLLMASLPLARLLLGERISPFRASLISFVLLLSSALIVNGYGVIETDRTIEKARLDSRCFE